MKCFIVPFLTSFLLFSGILSTSNHPKIYNGIPAEIQNSKHQVSIRNKLVTKFFYELGFICGGSLIHPAVVLTAAHCLRSKEPDLYVAVMGTLRKSVKDEHTLMHDVEAIVVHPKYNRTTVSYDVGLVFLTQPVPGNFSHVHTIPLASSTTAEDTMCQVSGWGLTEENVLADELMTVDVPIVNIKQCNESYDGMLEKEGIVCAGYEEGVKDACNGDSGGPLVCDGVLTGVVSGGEGCGLENKPGIYADVFFFENWIREEMMKRNLTLRNNSGTLDVPLIVVVGMSCFLHYFKIIMTST